MINPTADDVLASIIDTFDRYLVPEIHDEYAASLAMTVSQLLRSVRARVAHEAEAIWDDNAELRQLLDDITSKLPHGAAAELASRVESVASDPTTYPSVTRLQHEAIGLRAALVVAIEAAADPDDPVRIAIREYLANELRRQEPWLVHAFTGPRR